MYRLVLYVLTALSLIALIFSLTGNIHYSLTSLLSSLIILLFVCYTVNYVTARAFNAPINVESSFITAYILFLILTPARSLYDVQVLVLVAGLAMLSKYFIAYKGKHIFNPAAIALVIAGLLGIGNSYWWVASRPMFWFVLILGLLVVRKIKRFSMFLPFAIVSTIIIISRIYNTSPGSIWSIFSQTMISWPIIFFGTIMLTEPLTTPQTRKMKIIYGVVVAVLFSVNFNFGPFHRTPELALVLGNLFAYIFIMRERIFLTLVGKKEIAKNVFEFSWKPTKSLKFKPGQYLEWTAEHEKPDARGNRRYFTIASSPTEEHLKLGIKLNEKGSSFKKHLESMPVGSKIAVGSLDGDFVLPEDMSKKLVFIAGGIGITPFRSIIKHLSDNGEKRDVTLFYSTKSPEEIAYVDIFEEASKNFGLKTVYILTDKNNTPQNWPGESGLITGEMLKKYISEHKNCEYYLSGPNAMVESYTKLIKENGVGTKHIHTDYFPGF